MFVSEDYSAVPRGVVSVPRIVVAGCSICVFFAMVVYGIMFQESGYVYVFWCSIFGVCVCSCGVVLSCSKVTIDGFVCIDYIENGDMEEGSECA